MDSDQVPLKKQINNNSKVKYFIEEEKIVVCHSVEITVVGIHFCHFIKYLKMRLKKENGQNF